MGYPSFNLSVSDEHVIIPLKFGNETIIPSIDFGATTPDMPLQEKTVVPTDQRQTVEPDNGFYGLAKVTVEAASGSDATPARITYVKTYETNGVTLSFYSKTDKVYKSTSFYTTDKGVTVDIGDVVCITYSKTYNPSNPNPTNTSTPTITVTGGEYKTLASAVYTSGSYRYWRYAWAVAVESETVKITVKN